MGCLDKQGLGRFSGEVQMYLLQEPLCKVRLVCGRPVGLAWNIVLGTYAVELPNRWFLPLATLFAQVCLAARKRTVSLVA